MRSPGRQVIVIQAMWEPTSRYYPTPVLSKTPLKQVLERPSTEAFTVRLLPPIPYSPRSAFTKLSSRPFAGTFGVAGVPARLPSD